MISASSELFAYFNDNIREEGQTLSITITKGGKTYPVLTDKNHDFIGSSVKITRKSVSGASFDIGECYIDSLQFTVGKDLANYKSLTGAQVIVELTVETDTVNETVKLGTFRIPQDGIKRTNTFLQVTADSLISRFDKSRKRATFKGDLWDLVLEACTKCNVNKGMSESEFRALSANTSKTYTLKKDSSLKTYRDAIMYVAQLIGGFATTDTDGKLIFKNYSSKNDTVRVNDNVIVDYSIGDEVYNLSGLGMSVGENDVYLYRDGEDDDSPYFLNLDTNPLLENSSDEEVSEIVGNIWSKLASLELNNFSFKFNGNPLIEIGDIISIPERNLSTYVASYEWIYHGKESLSCVSVDKSKRTETQREKQNENKKSDSAEDARVDDLIKKTTTGTKKVTKKKTVTYTDIPMSYSGSYNSFIKTPYINGRKFSAEIISPTLLSIYDTIKNDTNKPFFDRMDIDFSNTKSYIYCGYTTGVIDYSKLKEHITNIQDTKTTKYINTDNSSLIKGGAIEVSFLGIDDNTENLKYTLIFNGASKYEYYYKYLDNPATLQNRDTVNYFGEYILNFKPLVEQEDFKSCPYTSLNNNILTLTLTDYNKWNLNIGLTNALELYKEDYLATVKREDFSGTYTKTNEYVIASRDDITSEYGNKDLFMPYYTFEDDKDNYNNLINSTTEFTVTYYYEEEESYNVTIEGTSDKINDTDKKAEDNKSEIEKLQTAVSNLKTSVKTNTARIKDLISRVGVHDNTISATREDTARLDQRVTKLENSSGGGSSSGVEITEAEKKQITTNKENIASLNTQVSNNTQGISTNATNISNLTQRVSTLEQSGGSGGSTIDTETKEQVKTNTQEISTLKTNVSNLTQRVTTLEQSGGSGGSTIDTETKQQVATNKSNIEALQLTVGQHTTSIEDIIKRLVALEQGGGGGETAALKFLDFALKFNEAASNKSYYYPSFKLENYLIDGVYYLSETNTGYMLFNLIATLNKTGSTQTFRQRNTKTSTDYTIIDTDITNMQSSNIQFIRSNQEFYYDCQSKLDNAIAQSKDIVIKTYPWLTVTKDTNWLNETTGGKVTAGAHNGDIINLRTTFTGGFKAYSLENKSETLNKYYYKVVFGSGSSTTHYDTSATVVQDWVAIDAEPGVLTDIKFTFKTEYGGKTVLLFVSDGQYVTRADYDRIPLLT